MFGIGNWDDVEVPLAYGYSARAIYGAANPHWNDELADTLRTDWEEVKGQTRRWDDVSRLVRHGYEYAPEY
jgi:hypothetical protein